MKNVAPRMRHSIATGTPAHDILAGGLGRDFANLAAGIPGGVHPHLMQFTFGAMGGGPGGAGGPSASGGGGGALRKDDRPPPSSSAGTAFGNAPHPHPGGREAAERRRRSGPPVMMNPGGYRPPKIPQLPLDDPYVSWFPFP